MTPHRYILVAVLSSITSFLSAQILLSDYWNARQPDLPYRYHSVEPLDTVLARVSLYDRRALIDIQGRLLTGFEYQYIHITKGSDLLTVSRNHRYGVIRRDGAVVLPMEHETVAIDSHYIRACNERQCRWLTLDGQPSEWSLPDSLFTWGHDQDGFFDVSVNRTQWGLCDKKGQWVIPADYVWLTPLGGGYWRGSDGKMDVLLHPARKWSGTAAFYSILWATDDGFWARKEDEAAPIRFYNFEGELQKQYPAMEQVAYAVPFHILRNKEQSTLYDGDNNVVLAGYSTIQRLHVNQPLTVTPPKTTSMTLFSAGNKDEMGVFDGKKWLVPPRYNFVFPMPDQFVAFSTDSVALFAPDGQWQRTLYLPNATTAGLSWLYSRTVPDSAWHFQRGWVKLALKGKGISDRNGLLCVHQGDNRYALMNDDGTILVEQCEGSFMYATPAQLQVFSKNSRFGWINTLTRQVVAPLYDRVEPLTSGAFLVQKNLRWGLMNHLNQTLCPIEYEDMKKEQNNSAAMLKKDGLWYVFAADGQPLISGGLDDVQSDYGGGLWGKTARGWRLYDRKGNVLWPEFLDAPAPQEGMGYVFKKNGKWGSISANGEIIIPFEWDTLAMNTSPAYAVRGDSVMIVHEKVLLKGQSVLPFGVFGYAVSDNNRWKVCKKHGETYPLPAFLTPPMIDPVKNGFWGQPEKNTWNLYDTRGHITQSLQADSLFQYSDVWLGIFNNTDRYILNQRTGMRQPWKYEHISSVDRTQYFVHKDNKIGVADLALQEVIPCKYDRINTLNERLFQVKLGKKTGALDRKGQVCIPLDEYSSDHIRHVGEGVFTVEKNGLTGIYSFAAQKWIPPSLQDVSNCNIRMPLNQQLFWFRENGLYGIMDDKCKTILPPKYKKVSASDLYITLEDEQGQHLYDPVRQRIIAGGFDAIRPWGKNVLCSKGQQYSLYRDGELSFTKTAENIEWHKEQYLLYTEEKSGLSGLLRLDGSFQLPPAYRGLKTVFKDVLLALQQKGWGIIDYEGKVLTPMEYAYYEHPENGYDEWVLLQSENRRFGLFDRTGRAVLPAIYQQIKVAGDKTHFIAQKDSLWYFYDRSGQLLMAQGWEAAREFAFGLAAVQQSGKWGYVDLKGNVGIPLRYRYAASFSDAQQARTALVIRDKGYEVIGADGKVVFPENGMFSPREMQGELLGRIDDIPAYKEIPFYSENYTMSGYFTATPQRGGQLYGLINLAGEWVVRPEYDEFHFLGRKGKVMAAMRKGNLWGWMNFYGEVVMPPRYTQVEYGEATDTFRVIENGVRKTVNEKGE